MKASVENEAVVFKPITLKIEIKSLVELKKLLVITGELSPTDIKELNPSVWGSDESVPYNSELYEVLEKEARKYGVTLL